MTSTTTENGLRNLQNGDLQRLANVSHGSCVSILMPTHRRGRETQQDPIRLKNLLGEAQQKLKDTGQDESILKPIEALQNDSAFWQHQGDGLAIFLAGDQCQLLRLNRTVEESVHVGERFFLSPLIQEHNAQGQHFVLTLSWHEAGLFRCEGDSLTEVETELLPAKFDELVLPRDPEEALQNTSHQPMGGVRGTSVAMFHGQGEGEQKIEADRDQYLSIVGDEVAGAMYNSGMPLVVVATTEVAGHFESTNKVEIGATVEGSPSTMSKDEIQKAAHEAIAPKLKADYAQLIERLGTATANSQAATDLHEIIDAANNGKVDSLIICDTGCEKTNMAVVQTLRNGGDVFRCEAEALPTENATAAAIYRY